MSKDKVLPGNKWKFDAAVAGCFDDMLARSIPQYEVMRKLTTDLAIKFAQDETAIVDLGCSTGAALADIAGFLIERNKYIGVDVSGPMLKQARARFKKQIAAGYVDIQSLDLRTDYPLQRASVTLAVLCLQFIPIEYRQAIIQKVYKHTEPGGIFIVVEKILGETTQSNQAMIDIYYELKKQNGYDQDSIDRKRLSLEGVLVPISSKWNMELLTKAGFSTVECFWRWMNFAGWIAIK